MDPIAIKYLKALEVIGEETEKISDNFGNVSNIVLLKETEKTLNDVKNMLLRYKVLQNDFNRQYENLKNLTPPSILAQCHEKLLSSYNHFADYTQILIDSLNAQNGQIDFGTFAEGVRNQNIIAHEIHAISNEIVSIMSGNPIN